MKNYYEGSPHHSSPGHGGTGISDTFPVHRRGAPSGAAVLIATGGMGASAPINGLYKIPDNLPT
jgi:hypothetical protein